MPSIRFYLKPLPSGNAHINFTISHKQKSVTKYLGYSIPANKVGKDYKHWNTKEQRARSHAKANEINKRITEYYTIYSEYLTNCNLNHIEFNVAECVNMILNVSVTQPTQNANNLVTLTQHFIESKKNVYKIGTLKHYKVILGAFKDYQTYSHSQLELSTLTPQFFREFQSYLLTKLNNTNPTVNRKMVRLKTILKFAVDELNCKNIDIPKAARLKSVEASKFPLLPEEIHALKKLPNDLLSPYGRIVLDAFLLSVETGLRYSDVCQLQPQHISQLVENNNTLSIITITAVKTDKKQTIPLSTFAQHIINKYLTYLDTNTYPISLPDSAKSKLPNLFKFVYSQSVSRELKKVFKIAGVNRLCEKVIMKGGNTTKKTVPFYEIISFHMARNTYITRLLASGLPSTFVRDNVGHATLKTTEGYYRDSDRQRIYATLNTLNKDDEHLQ